MNEEENAMKFEGFVVVSSTQPPITVLCKQGTCNGHNKNDKSYIATA